MGTPLVEAEQDRPIRVEDLPEVVMDGRRLRLAKERLVPLEAASHIAHADDRPGYASSGSPFGLTCCHSAARLLLARPLEWRVKAAHYAA